MSTEETPLQQDKSVPEEPPFLTRAQAYQGPIPPASELEKYEKVLEGAANRILTLAEHNGAALRERQTREMNAADEQIKQDGKREEYTYLLAKRGQNFAITLGCFAIAAGIYAMYLGDKYMAAVFVGVPVAAMVLAFLKPNQHHGSKKISKND